MSEDLLEKEKEFRRVNKELQERTRGLMKEMELVMASRSDQRSISNFNKSTLDFGSIYKSQLDRPPEQLTNPPSNIPQDNPSSKGEFQERIGISSKNKESSANKAIVTFLNAKIEMLTNELQTIQTEYKKKCDYCKQLELEQKKFEDLKGKMHSNMESLKDTTTKLETTNADLRTRLQSLQTENSSLTKDLETLERRSKTLQQESNNYEIRLNRSVEDNEKLKNSLKVANIEEKELRTEIRKLQEENRLTMKNLEKQRSEIVHVFKKQTLLVDNLKKQIAYLIAAGHARLTEEEFSRLLDRTLEDI